MPYSKLHNVLFLHIPKCAGKSFEVALGITSKEESEKYKWRSFFNRGFKYLLTKTKDVKAKDRLWGTFDISLALQHATFCELELLGLIHKEKLDNSIKVAIVRNSFDRAVSSYLHMGKGETFLEFVKTYFYSENRDHNDLAHKRTQLDFIRNKKGDIILDYIIRFEYLEKDYEAFKLKYKIDAAKMPHIGKQRIKKNYKEYYCEESLKVVSDIFKEDIEYFNFTF